jgi:secreted PhoX family phosphatase
MPISRRAILTGSASGVGLAVAGAVPSLAATKPGSAVTSRAHRPFGPLVDDPAGLLALPAGFEYGVVTYAGRTTVKGGAPTPSNHDGTAVFDVRGGRLRLIQNHELGAGSALGVPHVAGTVYDESAIAAGGCTVIETDRRGRNLGEHVGISGTVVNCAGGPTPWGTWLTCEETEIKAGAAWSANGQSGVYAKDHGYVFEVFHDGRTLPKPIKAFGRYAHEAVAVDPTRTRVYLSEDAKDPNGLFYRWTAPRGVKLHAGVADQLGPAAGTLEAMAILLPDVAYLTSAQLGRPFPVRWVAVPERDGRTTSVRKQFTGEITRGKKFEGVYGTREGVYVVNSFAFNTADLPADAVKHDGMVWFYSYRDQTITLVTYFPHQDTTDSGAAPRYDGVVFDGPDNVTVTPWGTLVLAEDGVGASHVLSSVPGGPTYAIARNMLNIGSAAEPEYSEFTGPTFSSDGTVLFVNIQTPGITLAITGPWERYLA